jgi:RND family efflux transporter MFP subunit
MSEDKKYPTKRKGFLLLTLALLVIVGLGFGAWRTVQTGQLPWTQATSGSVGATATAGAQYKTTTVRRNDIALTVSGSGSVISAKSVDLGFSVEGTVAVLNVQVGDKVTQGQVLASLGDTAAIRQTVLDQQLAVQVAQKNLDDLLSNAPSALAQAQASQAAAEQAYAEAQTNLHQAGDSRCAPAKTEDLYFQVLNASKAVNEWESYLSDGHSGYGKDYILTQLVTLRKKLNQANGNYTYCQGYTQTEIQTSQANLQLAKAKLDQANADYASLKASSGVDSVAVEIARATLKNAQLQLTRAQTNLAGTTITAPINGTVTTLNGKLGDDVTTGTFITLTDLEQPEVQVNIDETDLQNFGVGCAATVTFDSLTGQTFEGTVTQVSPVMVTVNSSSMVQGLIDLQKKTRASGKPLPVGMTASIEVTCKQAKNALVVPAQALYEPTGQPAYVYVLTSQGEPEKRMVEVGLKTIASAQITSGLTEGEKVITTEIK